MIGREEGIRTDFGGRRTFLLWNLCAAVALLLGRFGAAPALRGREERPPGREARFYRKLG